MSNPEEKKQPDMMGYEEQITIPEEVTLPETSNADDVQALINKAVKEVTVDDNGKYVYPKDMDPVLKAAVAATKSYRDNQSGFTKSQQTLKETEAEVAALRKKLADVTAGRLELSKDERKELEELKQNDPDAWRVEMNRLEAESQKAIQEELDTVTEEVKQKAGADYELKRRYQYLEEFNKDREVPITPEILDTEIPPRITNKLAEGKLTFEGYLDEVAEYLEKGKTVSKKKAEQTTDLNKLNGSSTPNANKKEEEEFDYSNITL